MLLPRREAAAAHHWAVSRAAEETLPPLTPPYSPLHTPPHVPLSPPSYPFLPQYCHPLPATPSHSQALLVTPHHSPPLPISAHSLLPSSAPSRQQGTASSFNYRTKAEPARKHGVWGRGMFLRSARYDPVQVDEEFYTFTPRAGQLMPMSRHATTPPRPRPRLQPAAPRTPTLPGRM
ncbi:protodermal factor 1-like [Portunus trituberculatus]|uniref:protodermal factor 1-like n=1 Tax=Portunus trituberculatus TaxID=210409 RepID=UPI001E1D08EF|nr:protodermal factor 1-like [Portunus trituberculatus]